MVVNTPTIGKRSNSDGFKIRRLTTECRVPCFTSLDTVKALRHAIKDNKNESCLVPFCINDIRNKCE
jgi:carbamoyl-phosphate synthase large subunit